MDKTHSPKKIRSMSFGAALGTAAAVLIGSIGFGSLSNVSAEKSSGDRPVFISINPCRVTDTRPSEGIGGRTTPIAAAETMDVSTRPMTGDCSSKIPNDALSVQLNVTALNASERTFLTLFPKGAPQPKASALNPSPGQPPVPNAVTTAVNSDGEFSVYNDAGSVNILIDISGYYVHHNHDDDRPTRIQIGHTDFAGLRPDMPDSRLVGSGFIGSNPLQCMIAHLPITEGMGFDGLSVSGFAPAPTEVTVRLLRVRHAAGTGLSVSDVGSEIASATFNGGGTGVITQGVINPATPVIPDLDTYGYYVSTCSDDPYVITGATLGVQYSS